MTSTPYLCKAPRSVFQAAGGRSQLDHGRERAIGRPREARSHLGGRRTLGVSRFRHVSPQSACGRTANNDLTSLRINEAKSERSLLCLFLELPSIPKDADDLGAAEVGLEDAKTAEEGGESLTLET